MATEQSCLFCKIVAGEIPSEFIYSDDQMVAFRDISPKAPVHLLIVPREHHPHAAATAAAEPALIGQMIAVADSLSRQSGHPAYNLLFNTGEEAGQTIFHTHLHLLAGGKLTELPV